LHAATGASLAPMPWSEDPGSAGELDGAEVIVECPDLCQRFTARVFEDVTVAPSPLWLKARLTAGRAETDQQRRRHHQLRDAADRPAAARVRPRPCGRPTFDGAPRGGGRASGHARRRDAHARRGDDRDRRCRRPDVDRGREGRRPLGGAPGDDARAAGGGDVERPEHPPHVVESGSAQRGLGALREGLQPSSAYTRRPSRRGY